MSFSVISQVSWLDQPQRFDLVSASSIFETYPLISSKFFNDLVNNVESSPNYWTESGFRGLIMGGKNYEPHEWIFLWALDFKDRLFWILFSRSPEMDGRGAIAAMGPNDLAGFMKQVGKESIVATLSLINDPTKMKKVCIIVSNPNEAKAVKPNAELQRFKKWVQNLKMEKNVDGQWFPTKDPVCPKCGERLLGVADVRIGFVQMMCPKCGYEHKQKF